MINKAENNYWGNSTQIICYLIRAYFPNPFNVNASAVHGCQIVIESELFDIVFYRVFFDG